MNKNEIQMLDFLKEGQDKYGFTAIKSEFEAEGVRDDEMLRLIDVTRKSNLDLAIKIGGCEAISDLYKAKLLGAQYVIAPMIESKFALQKFINATDKVYDKEEKFGVKFLFNLETINCFNQIDQILTIANSKNNILGIVFGRVDFAGSLGLAREDVSSLENYILEISKKCQKNNLDMVVGGAVSINNIQSIINVWRVYLKRFETRKIIFNAEILGSSPKNISKALELAFKFELLWLNNKKIYYQSIANEDKQRIEMLKNRI